MTADFLAVTEIAGDSVSRAQLSRFYQRYIWAGTFCKGKDVLELGCGTGPGLGYLTRVSKSLIAGDYSAAVLAVARAHYDDRIALYEVDAQATPFPDASFDVVILFEAIYYLPNVGKFFTECRRLLRLGGVLLLATANRDLYDFNPSPLAVAYYNPPELTSMLSRFGFESQFFGGDPVAPLNLKSWALRLAKKIAVTFHLIPSSMRGKRWIKRLVFGKLVPMPREFTTVDGHYDPPRPINGKQPDKIHQVLYCVAKIR